MLARGSGSVLYPTTALMVIAGIIGYWQFSALAWALCGLFFIFDLFAIYFFRDPQRIPPPGENLLVAPADGQVVVIAEVNDPFAGPARQVSIFMSPFNVHVNRLPLSGIIRRVAYHRGNFHAAFRPEATFENERNRIELESAGTRLVVTQVAGAFARRIVCHVQEGQQVQRGERIGLIRFGSRVDLLLPRTIQLKVRIGERVRAGVTIIGELPK